MKTMIAATVLTFILLSGSLLSAAPWLSLEPGLELGSFACGNDAVVDLHVLRVDPERWEFVLLNASATGEGKLRSARGWSRSHGLAAAMNASLYQADYRTSTALMRTRDHINNAYISKDNTVLAFDRRDTTVARFQIIDRTCDDLDTMAAHYGTLIQGIRMVSCRGNNVWARQKRKHNTAAIGIDGRGRVLMIYCERALSTHDLIDLLLELPIDLRRCQYTEGGMPAQMFVSAGGKEYEFVGGLAGGLGIGDGSPVPNVIGVRAR